MFGRLLFDLFWWRFLVTMSAAWILLSSILFPTVRGYLFRNFYSWRLSRAFFNRDPEKVAFGESPFQKQSSFIASLFGGIFPPPVCFGTAVWESVIPFTSPAEIFCESEVNESHTESILWSILPVQRVSGQCCRQRRD